MTVEEFEETLRAFLRSKPFRTFVVEKTDGTTILVAEKAVVFNAGVATYVTKGFDWVHFSHDETRAIRAATPSVLAAGQGTPDQLHRSDGAGYNHAVETGGGHTMSVDEFEETLRKFLRSKPFWPFVVEKTDGTTILVGDKCVVFNAGVATYVPEDFNWVDFSHKETKSIRLAVPEVTA